MVFELRQNLKLTQQLVMTPQLQQSIKLLQLSRLELMNAINQELEQNPLLEEQTFDDESDNGALPEPETPKADLVTKEITGEGDGKEDFDWDGYFEDYGILGVNFSRETVEAPSLENMITRGGSLSDHLLWQLNLSKMDETEKTIAREVIGNLDGNGYLMVTCEELSESTGADLGKVENTLAQVQEFDPPGIAARNLQECLLLQVKMLGITNSLVKEIIEEHLKDLETKNYDNIAKKKKTSIDSVIDAASVVCSLDPKPGRQYGEEKPDYIVPDVYVFKVGDEFRIVLNDDGLPRLKISSLYKKILTSDTTGGTRGEKNKEYIKERLQSATWLIKSIQQRQRTIFKVSESILKHQIDFFEKGINYLKPMVLRDIADDVGMHESTISRVTTNKYIHTPRGIFELKYFFNSSINRIDGESIASESVKEKISKIVSQENPKKPYNDGQIVKILEKSGITIARRTVAKYREMLNILPSYKRKKYY
ncbi:MAG: RNA polymerase factor sigma-54 [Syntrophales bacterium]|nr:RNA polymerase factor sigma-54 [Syntrophales bacterium]MDY0043287.1 RNA polymerase factor sigma-54 [Syntrophales bacterium]